MRFARFNTVWRSLGVFLGVCVLLSAGVRAQVCSTARVDAKGQVVKVYDGDTVRLADGRRLRLIGLDTPELGYGGIPDQPLAQDAAQALSTLLEQHDSQVLMRYDAERRDEYGRWLVHLYLPNKTSITAHLLRSGLATWLTVPPDTYNLDCYQRAEASARAANVGIWRLPEYQIIDSTNLASNARGFHRVRSVVTRIGQSQCCVWLDLEGDVALRVDRDDLGNFPGYDFYGFEGEQVTARGWLYERNGELRMQIRHPAAIESVH